MVALPVTHSKTGSEIELIFRAKALKGCLELGLAGQRISAVSIVDSPMLVRQFLSSKRSIEKNGFHNMRGPESTAKLWFSLSFL